MKEGAIKKIAFFTPLHPQRTGIADYAEEMLPYLRQALGDTCRIDFFTEECRPNGKDVLAHHRIRPISEYPAVWQEYDLAVYQMGNNDMHLAIYQMALQYPGIVILHDFAIHHMVAALFLGKMKDDVAYFNEVGYNHGPMAKHEAYTRAIQGKLGLWETDALEYPMNRRLADNSLGLVVFSDYAKKRLAAYQAPVPIHRLYLHCGGEVGLCTRAQRDAARERLGMKLNEEEIVIGVFGFIAPAKRPVPILDAVDQLRKMGKKLRLVYVGRLESSSLNLLDEIKKRKMEPFVKITGFVSSEEFLDYLDASDVCVSLRYPTMGETSGVLYRAMSRGKPSIVTDVGTFCELTEDMVAKISYGQEETTELVAAIKRILDEDDYRERLVGNSLKYAREHLQIQSTAKSLAEFLKAAMWMEDLKKTSCYQEAKKSLISDMGIDGQLDDRALYSALECLEELLGGMP